MIHFRHIAGAAFAAALVAFASCKPSQQAYADAYHSTIAAREAAYEADSAAYTRMHPQIPLRRVAVGTDTVSVATIRVAVTANAGGIRESLKPYSVVVGDFRQVFNARQMRERIVDAHPAAFVVQSAAPRYYVIASSHATLPEAAAALQALSADTTLHLRAPLPFILTRPL